MRKRLFDTAIPGGADGSIAGPSSPGGKRRSVLQASTSKAWKPDATMVATVADADDGEAARPGPPRRRRPRPSLAERDRLADALRVTRAVLRRIAVRPGQLDAGDAEAVRSAIEAADTGLGGPG